MNRITMVIADDHPIVRAGLQGLLTSQTDFEVVGEASNGHEAVELACRYLPQVALIDLRMPVLDGVETTRQIRQRSPGTQVLILTTYDTDADILRAIEAGATGYLLKETPRDDLFRAVRATARGQSMLSPSVASRLVGHARGLDDRALSARELEVLAQVAKGTSNKLIARDLGIGEATVKTHLLHIFTKLGVDDRTAAVTVAIERGILPASR